MLSKKELGKFRDAREELHKKDESYRRAANSDFIIYLLTLMAVAYAPSYSNRCSA